MGGLAYTFLIWEIAKEYTADSMKGKKHRIRIFYRSLTVKWILITCAIVLPVNILTAFIASMMNKSYQDNLLISYAGQLDLYGERVDSELSTMRNLMQNFLDSTNLSKLTWVSRDDSVVEVTRFKNRLTGGNSWCSFPGICMVWDKKKDIISFFHQGSIYSKTDTDRLEQKLREEYQYGVASEKWEWVAWGDKAFLFQYYKFALYDIGIFLDAESVLRKFYDAEGIPEGGIFLADREGSSLCCYDGNRFQLIEEPEEGIGAGTKRQIVLSSEIAGGSYQLLQVIEMTRLLKELPLFLTVIYMLTTLGFVSIPCVYILAVRLVLKPLKVLVEAMQKLEGGNLDYHLKMTAGSTELDFLYQSFNHMVDELNRMVIDSYEREIEKLQSDSINMRLQVNQHMLLNFLNTIYSLAQVEKNEQIGEFSLLLMKYFRYVLRQDIGLVMVKEEMEFVQDYLKIQKVRFPDSFTTVYSLDESAEEILIPQLLIENFVENAIKYGLVMGNEIEIIMNAHRQRDKLLLSVCDTGAGMEQEVLDKLRAGEIIEDCIGKHIGIWNCRRRLKYYYGEDYTLQITSQTGAGTQIWLELPIKPGNREETAKKLHRQDKGDIGEYSDCG